MHSEHYQTYEAIAQKIGAEKLIPFLRYDKPQSARHWRKGTNI